METQKELVELKKDGHIAIIKIQNPPFNELSAPVLLKLGEILTEVKNDDSVKAVVLTGGKVFSIGADVMEIYKLSQMNDPEKIRELLKRANDVVNALENLGKLTVAAINGYCLGGGNELAMACSYRIASENAKFGQPEIKLGIIPGMGGTQRLPRLTYQFALDLLLTGDIIPAELARAIGLVNFVAPEKDFRKAVLDLINCELTKPNPQSRHAIYNLENINRIDTVIPKHSWWDFVKKSSYPQAAWAIMELVHEGLTKPLPEALEIEQRAFCELLMTEKAKRGIEKGLIRLGKIKEEKKPAEQPAVVTVAPKDNKTEELKMMRDMVRDFAENRIRPLIPQMEKEKRISPMIINEMADLGLFGVSFDEKYGGTGLGLIGFCVLTEELARVHGSIAVMVGAHQSLACKAIYLFGTEDQKNRYLVPGIKGEKIGAYATTEPGVGSDLANIKTTAKKENGVWVLNGAKQFISNGAIADFVIVLAQTDPNGGNKTQAMFIVDTTSSGFKITKETEEKIGLHASCTSAFSMDNLIVPEGNLLGTVGQGFKIAMNVFNQSRISLGAGCLGSVKAALDEVIKFAKDRYIGGEPLWMKQLTQVAIGKISAVIYKLETLVYHTAALWDKGVDVKKEAAIIKYVAGEEACEAIDLALQVHGGSGYIEDYPIARIYRDVRVNRIFEGTSEVQLLLIAKEVLKEKLM